MNLSKISVTITLISLIACSNERIQQANFYAFGTRINISLYGVTNEDATNAIAIVEEYLSHANKIWHVWMPSTITDINTAIKNSKLIMISFNVEQLISQAQTLATNSQNLFNPAAGRLFELWGYHADNWFESRPPPSEELINKYLNINPTMEDISIDYGILSSNNTGVKLGFGGLAKGYIIDIAISALQSKGIRDAIINIGGDLRVIGAHGKHQWIAGIRHPRKDGILASVVMNDDESVFSSGDYERYFEYKNIPYPHLFDPRTGYPAKDTTSVTVLHNNAAQADAAATALFVAGRYWPAIAAKMEIKHVMVVRLDGRIELSKEMMKRVNLINKKEAPIMREIIQILKPISP
ncbi:MAG: FAD:protein FMN transferase [Piscirickettsiaceae bacterium]|nr:FAD:protein FMN transferase [Piscirickettsiaceae bacterium]